MRPADVDAGAVPVGGRRPGRPVTAAAAPRPLAQLPAGSAARAVRVAAVRGLPGAPAAGELAAGQDALLPGLAAEAGLVGPVLRAVGAGDLEVGEGVRERLSRAHGDEMARCLEVEARLLEVDDWFAAAGGVEYLVVKGPAVAHLDEADPADRAFTDLDLLVRGSSVDRALAVLAGHGGRRQRPERRPGFDRRFEKSVAVVGPDGIEVDVHRTLTGRAHGFRIGLDALFTSAEPWALGGHRLQAPSRAHRTLHAAYHAIVGSPHPPLRTIRDLARYLSDPDLDPARLAPDIGAWRAQAVVAAAVRAVDELVGVRPPAWHDWPELVDVPASERELLARGRRTIWWPVEWTAVRELPARDRLAFAFGVAFPSSAFLRAEGRSRRRQLSDGVGKVRRALLSGR